MTEEELEDLREKVARKQRAEEGEVLKKILQGTDEPIDPNAIYLTVNDIALRAGVCVDTVRKALRSGWIKSRMAYGHKDKGYRVLEKDAELYIKLKVAERMEGGRHNSWIHNL
jgi:hypothetical protein